MRQAFSAIMIGGMLCACTPRALEPDAHLVSALVAVHLHDARRATLADTLWPRRDAVLRPHGFDSLSLQQALGTLATNPPAYAATLAAVSERLSTRLRLLPEAVSPAPPLPTDEPPPPP